MPCPVEGTMHEITYLNPRRDLQLIQHSDNRNLIENGHVGRTALEASCVAHALSQQARLHPWPSAPEPWKLVFQLSQGSPPARLRPAPLCFRILKGGAEFNIG